MSVETVDQGFLACEWRLSSLNPIIWPPLSRPPRLIYRQERQQRLSRRGAHLSLSSRYGFLLWSDHQPLTSLYLLWSFRTFRILNQSHQPLVLRKIQMILTEHRLPPRDYSVVEVISPVILNTSNHSCLISMVPNVWGWVSKVMMICSPYRSVTHLLACVISLRQPTWTSCHICTVFWPSVN